MQKKEKDKIQLHREVKTAFYALCAVLFPDDTRAKPGMVLFQLLSLLAKSESAFRHAMHV
jgi:hypothetical protein